MKYKLAVKVPEQKTKLFNFHTLPITYETNIDYMQQRTPVVKRIENREKIHLAKHLEETYGLKNFDLPIKVSGEFHVPPQLTYEELVSIMMTTENHINVEFHPSSETPREIVLTGEGKIFESSNDRSEHRSLKSFYSKSKFDNEMERDYERFYDDEDQEKHRSKKLDEYLDNYEPRKMYKHFFNAKIHTVGGRREKSAKLEVRGSTDDKLRFINAQVNIIRTPLNEESREWTLKTNVQALLPEQTETHKYEERRNDKHQRFVCNIESEWGSERKQMINTNINGEQIRNKMWSEKIRELEQNDRYEMPKIREQMNRKVAFLNKYDIQTEYKNIQPSTAEFFNWGLSILKGWNLWQTKVELKNNRNGQVLATIVIDPLTHEHANVTLKTPTETIRVDSFQLPMKVKPFKLVNSPLQTSVDSFSDVIKSYATEKRAECKVDSRKVETFDDVTYKAPLTKCYSVLAKDCNNERPRFVVLMKKVDNQNKKLKMLTGSDKIEVESESRDRLVVKVNGRKIDDYENLKDYGVEYSEDMVRINTRDVSVRFDGEKAWVKISPLHKNKQCGLCGHYDDQEDDEFRMNNNELTSDIKAFHKSYSLSDDECRSDMDDSYQREQYERTWESREFNERNDNNEIKPIEKTEIIEHTHKICFSVKPTPACPEGSYAEKTKDQKTKFICMDRSEGRRLLREARRNPTSILDLPKDQNPSFTETLRVPSTCVVY